jgi:leucyl aminopeptidase
LRYNYKKGAPTFGVVGKGITFDSGGISIKPSDKMHEMKMDMAGAAATIGFLKIVASLKPKINVVGVTPLTENLPGGGALKPGDVVTSLKGKTIEVLNTDAEGRVVLADALTLAQKFGATKIVDLATLTGAVIVALGNEATAALGNDEAFTKKVIEAGNQSGERVWPLPLYAEHKEMLKSDIADLANIPPSRGAGVIAGAVFLQEFIEPSNSWVHLDIAGTAWLDGEKPYLAKGATGVGIRTLLSLLEELEKEF